MSQKSIAGFHLQNSALNADTYIFFVCLILCASIIASHFYQQYVENIQVLFTGIDINVISQRQRLHSILDEAIETPVSDGLSENSTPLILKRNGIRIKLKC